MGFVFEKNEQSTFFFFLKWQAAQMGQALLETNESLKAERDSVRGQLDRSLRRLQLSQKQATDQHHDVEDMQTRMKALASHLSRLESDNEALLEQVAEKKRRDLSVTERDARQEREVSELESLLEQEEARSVDFAGQMKRMQVESDRWAERCRVLEEETVPQLREEGRQVPQLRQELESWQRRAHAQTRRAEELGARNAVLEGLQATSESARREWASVVARVVRRPELLDAVALREATEGLVEALETQSVVNDESEPRQDEENDKIEATAIFLAERLTQPERWLLAGIVWRKQHDAVRKHALVLEGELSTVRLELEQQRGALVSSGKAEQSILDEMNAGESLAQALAVSELEERLEEAETQHAREKEQLLALVAGRSAAVDRLREARSELEESQLREKELLERKGEMALREAKKELYKTRQQLVHHLMSRDSLEEALARLQHRATSHAEQQRRASFEPPSTNAQTVVEEMHTQGERDVAMHFDFLQEQVQAISLQRDRFERLWRLESVQSKEARKESSSARVELFFSLCLSIKLAAASQGAPCNCNVQDIYERMCSEAWLPAEWPGKIREAMMNTI